MLNYMIYELELPDGQVKYYLMNFISKNMLSQLDDKVYSVTIVDSVV